MGTTITSVGQCWEVILSEKKEDGSTAQVYNVIVEARNPIEMMQKLTTFIESIPNYGRVQVEQIKLTNTKMVY